MAHPPLNIFERDGRPAEGTLRYGDHPDQLIDLFGMEHGGPLLYLLHGGFWRPEYDRSHLSHLCLALAATGRRVASVEYRRTPGHPDDSMSDVLDALDAMDPTGATVIGHSAGGHLALWCASAATGIARVVALAPVSDLQRAESFDLGTGAVRDFLGQSAVQRPDLDPAQLTPACDVVVISGGRDDRVPVEFARQYATAKGVRLIELAGADHFDLIDPLSPAFATVLGALT